MTEQPKFRWAGEPRVYAQIRIVAESGEELGSYRGARTMAAYLIFAMQNLETLRAENERLRAAICELFIYRAADDEIPCYARVTPRDLSHVSPQIKETLWAVLRAAEAKEQGSD